MYISMYIYMHENTINSPKFPLNDVFLSCKRHLMLSVGTKKRHEKTPPQQPARKAFVVVGAS